MPAFIQVIEFSTSRIDEIKAMADAYRARLAGASGPQPLRVTVTAARDMPGKYATMVEFESYEAAMENSARPETGEFAAAMMALCDGPPAFRNLDVLESYSL